MEIEERLAQIEERLATLEKFVLATDRELTPFERGVYKITQAHWEAIRNLKQRMLIREAEAADDRGEIPKA